MEKIWLPPRDSNLDMLIQSHSDDGRICVALPKGILNSLPTETFKTSKCRSLSLKPPSEGRNLPATAYITGTTLA